MEFAIVSVFFQTHAVLSNFPPSLQGSLNHLLRKKSFNQKFPQMTCWARPPEYLARGGALF